MITKKSILTEILTIPKNRLALVSKTREISYKDIVTIYEKNKELISSLENKCIAIHSSKREDLALLLAILDGNTKRIVFIPEDIQKKYLEKYYTQAHVHYEVSLDNDILKLKIILNTDIKLLNENTEWIIPTSGTTSSPKLISHTFDSLTTTVKKNIQEGDSFIWGLTFDIYRFSGIQVFLQSILSGSRLIISESNFSIDETINLFANNSCNIISATPSFWRKVLMSPASSNLCISNITLGGEISDQTILDALIRRFPEAKIVHIYASTEVGVGFCVNDKKGGFPLAYVIKGIKEVQIKIIDNLLFIKSNKKIQYYLSKDNMYNDQGFINTGDLVEIRNDRVYFKGRESGSINVGGNKVHPEEVEFLILKSGLVNEVKVYAKKNSMMGNLVYADIVLSNQKQDEKVIKKLLFKYCNNNLDSFKVPAMIKILKSIDITNSGKIKRN